MKVKHISFLAFAVALCVIHPHIAVSQMNNAACVLGVTVEDSTCSAHSNCLQMTRAELTTFTAPCTGPYTYSCKTVCPDPRHCSDCVCCSRLKDLSTDQNVAVCNSVVDVSGHCEGSCNPQGIPVELTQGHVYELAVTLYYCADNEDCAECASAGCKAKARVYSPGAPCDAF